jgi:hypothetical protein
MKGHLAPFFVSFRSVLADRGSMGGESWVAPSVISFIYRDIYPYGDSGGVVGASQEGGC